MVGGYAGGYDGDSDDNFVLARYLSNGTLDKTFGAAKTGMVDQDLGDTGDEAILLIIGSSQYLIEGGSSNGQFAMAAFTPNGILDSSFGSNGIVKTSFSGQTAAASASLALGPNYTIEAAGTGSGRSRSISHDTLMRFRKFRSFPLRRQRRRWERYRRLLKSSAMRVAVCDAGLFRCHGYGDSEEGLHWHDAEAIGEQPGICGAATVMVCSLAVKPPIATIPEIGYVDIPAGKQTADVTITPIDHGVASANKTAIFTLQSNTLYDINSDLKSTTITIVGDGSQPRR